jgi:hypothetical protein
MSGPNTNEETQRLIETAEFHLPTTASLPKRRLSPNRITALRSPHKDETATKPMASTHPHAQPTPTPAHQQPDVNTFEESFTAALLRPGTTTTTTTTTYDGQLDNDEYSERTPLLNSCYNNGNDALHSPSKSTPYKPSRIAPLEPASKSKPSRSICLWHEISHSSQYTRPAAEMLREVLEERYPAVPPPVQQSVGAGEQVGGDRRRWWRKILRRRPAV